MFLEIHTIKPSAAIAIFLAIIILSFYFKLFTHEFRKLHVDEKV